MKKWSIVTGLLASCIMLAVLPAASFAGFVSGSTGADGDFTPTANTLLQIPDSGVFNFGVVNIPSGVTVTFTRNADNTPVTILATGDVTINGTISVNGTNGSWALPGAGGPGGFDGGQGGPVALIGKKGEGPGGASAGSPIISQSNGGGCGGGGGFAFSGGGGGTYSGTALGGGGGAAYGNDRMIPFIGGSGGGGGGGTTSGTAAYVGGGGGGGGGAILIASSGTITIGGGITANGGGGANGEYFSGSSTNGYYGGGGGGGSGGSIRLVANTISGNGTLSAAGAGGGQGFQTWGGSGSAGRIRLEYTTLNRTASSNPVPTQVSTPGPLTPSNMPVLTIASVGGVNVPVTPKGAFSSPDVLLPFDATNPVAIVVNGTNIPAGQTVTVKATPSVGTATSASATLTGAGSSTSATVSISLSTSYPSLITATVTYQLASLNLPDIYINGEKVESIRVASSLGGRSAVTYITVTGKEIAAL